MNARFSALLAVLLLFSVVPALADDPCPVCGGRVTGLHKVKDDRSREPKNYDFFNRSICGMMDMMNAGAVICTRCWMGSRWDEESWKRGTRELDTFVPPLAKEIRNFPAKPDDPAYCRLFEGANLTDFLEFEWDDSHVTRFAGFREYCKKHDLIMEMHGETAENSFGKTVVVTDIEQAKPSEMGFTWHVSLVVKTKPKALYAKPLPPKRPVELRTSKAEYLRSAETLRIRYVNELLQMMKKADKANDDLAEAAVGRELKAMSLPKDSDPKELKRLLMGKWQSKTYAPIWRGDGVWNWGLKENKEESAPWRVEGNELVETYPKRENDDEILTRRFTILLLNKAHFIYLEESKTEDYVLYYVQSWERVPETKRR